MTPRQAVNDTIPLLTPAEVAAAFRVDPKTVTRWAKSGKLNSIRTLGGHRRFLATEVRAMLLDVPASEQGTAFLPWNGVQLHGQ
jgi:excisionase family DNA binding protein